MNKGEVRDAVAAAQRAALAAAEAAVAELHGASELTGETINIMTLGGLALAVGILVDEATVAIENIHAHRSRGTPLATAALPPLKIGSRASL